MHLTMTEKENALISTAMHCVVIVMEHGTSNNDIYIQAVIFQFGKITLYSIQTGQSNPSVMYGLFPFRKEKAQAWMPMAFYFLLHTKQECMRAKTQTEARF